MKTTIALVVVLLDVLFIPSFLDAAEPQQVLAKAVAVWQMSDNRDSVGVDSALSKRGMVGFGISLSESEQTASRVRGGDGKASQFDGGWLDAGQGHRGELSFMGDQFTAFIRLRCPSTQLWSTRGFFTKGGGHDRLVFNFFSYDFGQGAEGMRVGCELGVAGRKGLAAQVTAPIAQIGPTDWHDFAARYDGREFVLFVDGVALDRKPVMGQLRQGNTEPLAIGAGGADDNPFRCLVDHAAIWNVALNDEEIISLSGGAESVAQHASKFANFVRPATRASASELVIRSRELKQKFQTDPHRPRYHFLHAEEGRIMPGDPNGAIWWKGRYHLFYIFQREQDQAPKTVHCWGHASSTDLVHWEHHPTALDVAPADPDRGIFSGNAFVTKEGVPMILYHGVNVGNCVAFAEDDRLIRWKKFVNNPIVPSTKEGDSDYGKYDSWDPHGWLEGDNYFAIFGGNPHTGAKAALFKGGDISKLKFVRPFVEQDGWSQPGEDISCPDFFPLGNKHVLLCISHMRGARYFLGRWEDEHFHIETHERMNWPGGQFFAPESMLDDQGRRIIWAWCLDERPDAAQVASGWSGVMSLPRLLSLDHAGQVRIAPAPEYERLRFNHRPKRQITLDGDREISVDDTRGDCLELLVTIAMNDVRQAGVKVRRAPDGAEETNIIYDPVAGVLKIDVTKATLDPSIRYRSWCITRPVDSEDANRRIMVQEAPLKLKNGEPLSLRIFLDRSMLEVFANERQCVTQRLWPTRSDALGVSIFSQGGGIQASFEAWEMSATQPD